MTDTQQKTRPFPRTAIVTICWNSAARVNSFLAHLSTLSLQNTDILVIDNNSEIGFAPDKEIRNLEVIRLDTNTGFSGGANVGIRYCVKNGYDYVWLLNNDLELENSCLERLIAVAEDDMSIGALSPAIFDLEDRSKGQFFGAIALHNSLDIVYMKCDSEHQASENVLLWGTAMLIRCSALKRAGILNQNYFAYWEDFEFSSRLVRAGYKTLVVETAYCFHQWHENFQISRRAPYFYYYMTRNAYFFWKSQHESQISRMELNRIYLLQTLETISGRLSVGDADAANAIIQGYVDAHIGRTGIYKPRSMRILRQVFFLAPYFLSRILRGDYKYLIRRFR